MKIESTPPPHPTWDLSMGYSLKEKINLDIRIIALESSFNTLSYAYFSFAVAQPLAQLIEC